MPGWIHFFKWNKKAKGFKSILTIVLIFMVAVSICIFFIEIYPIPGYIAGTLSLLWHTGDKVLVNKLAYGP